MKKTLTATAVLALALALLPVTPGAAGNVAAKNGEVVVNGTNGDDEIVIDRSGSDYRFTISSNGSTTVQTAPQFVDGLPTNVVVEGNGGDDDFVIGITAGPQVEFLGNVLFDTGSGDDVVYNAVSNVEVVGSLTILTGSGDDSVEFSGSIAVTGDLLVETYSGIDDVAFSGAKGLIDTGDGDSNVVVTNYVGEALTILGGKHLDRITVSGNGVSPQSPQELTIDTEDGKDFVTLDNSSFAYLTIRAGGGSQSSATFDEVSIQDSIVYGLATFDGQAAGMHLTTAGTTFQLGLQIP